MICPGCKYENHSLAAFCSKCGSSLSHSVETDSKKPVSKLIVFFLSLLAYIAVLNFTDLVHDYTSVLIVDLIFALIVLIFFFSDTSSVIKLFKFGRKRTLIILLLFVVTPLFALLVYYFAGFLNHEIFDKSENVYYNQFKDSPAPLMFTLISVAIFPAIFEEIAFRGIMFSELIKVTRLKPAIIVSSVMFTLLHLSLLSALWIFPLGLVFGYLRARHRSIAYGMIGHFIYNASIVLYQIY